MFGRMSTPTQEPSVSRRADACSRGDLQHAGAEIGPAPQHQLALLLIFADFCPETRQSRRCRPPLPLALARKQVQISPPYRRHCSHQPPPSTLPIRFVQERVVYSVSRVQGLVQILAQVGSHDGFPPYALDCLPYDICCTGAFFLQCSKTRYQRVKRASQSSSQAI